MVIEKGMKRIMEYVVREDDSPRFLLDKGIGVLSTPRMIHLMEANAKALIDENIDPEYTSVGIHVDVYHKAPAPVGAKLVFEAYVEEVKGNKILFRVTCRMGDIVIGEGIHERAIVSWKKFKEHVNKVSKSV